MALRLINPTFDEDIMWNTDSHRESIAIGNRITLTISMYEERVWRAGLLVRTEFPDRAESERSIGFKTLDAPIEDPNAARAMALRWAREWLGDIATPLRLESAPQWPPLAPQCHGDPEVVAPDDLGEIGPWIMTSHEEMIRSGNLRVRIVLNRPQQIRSRDHWVAELFLFAPGDQFCGQLIACRNFDYEKPIAIVRSEALQWAHVQASRLTNAFAKFIPSES